MMRKSAFVNVSGVPNLVITYGGWIDDCSASEVVLVIPGKLKSLIAWFRRVLLKFLKFNWCSVQSSILMSSHES